MHTMSVDDLIQWRLGELEKRDAAHERRADDLEKEIVQIKIAMARWAAAGAAGGAVISHVIELVLRGFR